MRGSRLLAFAATFAQLVSMVGTAAAIAVDIPIGLPSAGVPVAAVALLVVGNITSIDDLGRAGWRGLLDLGPSGWSSKAAMENYAYGPFSYELDLARANVRSGERIVSSDGRLTYFFPQQVAVEYAHSCADLGGSRLFALLTGGESADIMTRLEHSSADPFAWLQCRDPRLVLVGAQEGIYAVYVVGGKPMRPSTPADCHVSSYAGALDDAVFAEGVSYAKARKIRDAAAKVGFGPKIEQTGCSTFRVVIPGLPIAPAKQADFRREALGAGFDVTFAPAVRYPEVPTDVQPMR